LAFVEDSFAVDGDEVVTEASRTGGNIGISRGVCFIDDAPNLGLRKDLEDACWFKLFEAERHAFPAADDFGVTNQAGMRWHFNAVVVVMKSAKLQAGGSRTSSLLSLMT
jgi:hypothetical protein